MMFRRTGLILISSASLVAACGANVQFTHGSGGDDATPMSDSTGTTTNSSSSSSGQGGARPQSCELTTPVDGPYAATFRLINNSAQTVYIASRNCNPPYRVTSCTDDYAEPLSLFTRCSVDCKLPPIPSCIQCGACFEGPIAVKPGQAYESAWAGYTYTFDYNDAGCACHFESLAPAARYRATVPVYETEQDVWDNNPLITHEVDFELKATQLDVEIKLVANP